MKWLALIIVLLFGALLLYAEGDLPSFGNPEAPASLHVSPYYVERALEETDTPNIVTAVLADYRGYDTFGETIVIFTAGVVCILLLMRSKADDS